MEKGVGQNGEAQRVAEFAEASGVSGPVTRARKRLADDINKRNMQLNTLPALDWLEPVRNEAVEEDDVVKILKQLPIEILLMVLGELDDSKDLQNCSNASIFLSNELAPRKTTYLFEEVAPHLAKYLSFNDVKSCRVVCKKWKHVVNETILDQYVRPYDDEEYLHSMEHRQTRFRPITKIMDNRLEYETFAAKYFTSNLVGKNPFLGGTLEVVVRTLTIVPAHFQDDYLAMSFVLEYSIDALVQFLKEFGFGKYVHHVIVTCHQLAPLVEARCWKYAFTCIHNCPNLKSVCIRMSHQAGLDVNFNRKLIPLTKQAVMLPQPPPPLPDFHTFEVVATYTFSIPYEAILSILTSYGAQLQKILLPHRFYRPSKSTTWPFKDPFSNLLELDVRRVQNDRILDLLSTIQAPIRKLSLYFSYSDPDMAILFRIFARFPLRYLELLARCCGNSPILRVPDVTDPNLQVLTLHTLKVANSVDLDYSFLLLFPNLQYLYIHERLPHDDGPDLKSRPSLSIMKKIASNETVQIHKFLYGGKMTRSNVWYHLPNLKMIVFERFKWLDSWKLTWKRCEIRRRWSSKQV